MSENLDLARSIYAAWERGDFNRADWAHPEIEFVRVSGLVDRDSRTGLASMAESYREFLSAWEDVQVEATEFRELDNERVLVLLRWNARGKTSGLDIAQIGSKGGASLFQVRGGKVTRLVVYADRDRALADLGLKE
jgi:ketosteroid isomerase-like protein